MSVVVWRRVLEGVEVSGKVGESLRIVERWIIRVDSPATPKLEIIGAIPVGYGSSHWEFQDCKAQEFQLSPADKAGMFWTLTVTFYVPSNDKKLDEETGIPADYWECSGGTSTVPLFVDINGDTITNSANDPLEGLEREREEESWTLTKYYEDDSWIEDRNTYAGTVNSASWAGGNAKEWKCYFKGARRKEIQDVSLAKESSDAAEGEAGEAAPAETRVIVETTWEFRREPETWKCMPWDVGFHELVSGSRKLILDSNQRPVKQPVALNSDGSKKAENTPPDVINEGQGVDIYHQAAFATIFGEPHIVAEE